MITRPFTEAECSSSSPSGSRPRIISYTSGLNPCGVASYQARLAEALQEYADLTTVRLPNERTHGADLQQLWQHRAKLQQLARESASYAGALIDFTDTFFNGSRLGEALFPCFLKSLRCPAVVLLHELPGRTDPAEVQGTFLQKVTQRLTHKFLVWNDSKSLSWNRYVQQAYFRRASHLMTHAQALIEARRGDLPPERLHLLPTPAYPLPWPVSYVSRHALDDQYQLQNQRVLLLLGFPQWSKGFDRAIEALPYLPEDVIVLQVGDAERCRAEVAKLEALAAELGVTHRFRRTGAVSDEHLAILLQRAEVGLAPFRQVHQSSSVGHMIGAGLPIVAQRIPPFEVLRADGAGILFTADHPRAFAAGIHEVLNQEELQQALAYKNVEYRARYSFRGIALYLLNQLFPNHDFSKVSTESAT